MKFRRRSHRMRSNLIISSKILKDALEYERYLKEVVNALETDEEFRKKLDNATDVDIRVSLDRIPYDYLHT